MEKSEISRVREILATVKPLAAEYYRLTGKPLGVTGEVAEYVAAIDKSEQGKGLGKALLKDALSRSLNAANEIGARVILVHAIDEEAKNFHKKFGFEESPVNDLHLMLLMKDLEKSLSSAPTASRS
jgi:GNAT superfamily N-acetyltransferase